MKIWFGGAALLLAAAAQAQVAPDPVALTQAGHVQCYSPNSDAKVCGSIDSYAPGPDGRVVHTARTLLSARPTVILTTRTPVTVDNGTICGAIRPADITAGELTVGGVPASAEDNGRIKPRLIQSLGPVVGKRICTRYTADGPAFRAHEVVDGLPENPAADQRVQWVRADEGYRVAP